VVVAAIIVVVVVVVPLAIRLGWTTVVTPDLEGRVGNDLDRGHVHIVDIDKGSLIVAVAGMVGVASNMVSAASNMVVVLLADPPLNPWSEAKETSLLSASVILTGV